MKCPLCGKIFDEKESRVFCAGCGKKDCGLIRCPNCKYEFPPDTTSGGASGKTASFLKKLFKKKERV